MEQSGLVEGDVRVGFLEIDEADVPLLTARVERCEDRILVTIPYVWDDQVDRTVERWFHGAAAWGDDPDKIKYKYSPPTEMDFTDGKGSIALVGCRPVGGTVMTAVNEGLISARFAILGARDAPTYRTINGLRSEIDGLGTWMNLRSLHVEHDFDEAGHLQSATLQLRSPDSIAITRELNLRVRPAFRFGPGEHPDETVVTERMLVESDVRSARGWEEHLSLHLGLRDLIRIASWRPLTFLKHEVTRDDDPLRTMDGAPHGRQWLPVETVATGVDRSPSRLRDLDFMFTYNEVGRRGVGHWLRLRRDWSRAVEPIVGLVTLRQARLEIHFAQLCIGLEALGYLLAVEAGVSKRAAGAQPFRTRLERIVADLNYPLGFDSAAWVDAATRAYRQVKHADNPIPDVQEIYATYYRGVHIFRAWVAGRLGIAKAAYARRQSVDRISRQANRADL